MLIALKMEEGAISQGKQLPSRIWERLVNKILSQHNLVDTLNLDLTISRIIRKL